MTVETVDVGPRRVCRRAVIAAPSTELFEIVAHPRQHRELDGSGTVGAEISGADRLSEGAQFSMHMKQHGFPYRITSKVTEFDEGRVVEWQHPMGHRWRWEFASQGEDSTVVTETFDYSRLGAAKAWFLQASRVPKSNSAGIEATLSGLQERFAH
jgi:hypothetical protein